MIARLQVQSYASPRAVAARTLWAMARHSDQSGGASRIGAEQARRLRRLRERFTGVLNEAAAAGGVSRFSWSRMEEGRSRIDTVALARFGEFYRVPTEYVISGNLTGLAPDLARELLRVEDAEASAAAHSAPAPEPEPLNRTGRKSTRGSGRKRAPAAGPR